MSEGDDTAAMGRLETFPVGVIVERRAARSRWVDEIWQPVEVFVGRGPGEAWRELQSGEGWTRYYAGTATLELHRTDAEALKVNLTSARPSIYVVLTPDSGRIPWRVHLVTASPSEAEAYMSGDNLVEPVPMPPEIAGFVTEFANVHFKPKAFRKRQRDATPTLTEERFGKEPIFARRAAGPGEEHDDG